MDEKIVKLRAQIDVWGPKVRGLEGSRKDELMIQYVENMGHLFKGIHLVNGPIKFSLVENPDGTVTYKGPSGIGEPVAEYNALGIWNLLETFKNDLTV